jgi:hypothetical protein
LASGNAGHATERGTRAFDCPAHWCFRVERQPQPPSSAFARRSTRSTPEG